MSWRNLQFGDRAAVIMSCFDLEERETEEILSRWSENTYPDNIYGEDLALAELLKMCRWASMNEQQRDDEKKRLEEQKCQAYKL